MYAILTTCVLGTGDIVKFSENSVISSSLRNCACSSSLKGSRAFCGKNVSNDLTVDFIPSNADVLLSSSFSIKTGCESNASLLTTFSAMYLDFNISYCVSKYSFFDASNP